MTASAHLRLVHSAPASDPAPEPPDPRALGSEYGARENGARDEAPPSDSRAGSLVGLGDDALVVLAVEGDNGAAERLYRRHARFAFNLAARIAGTRTDIEDVVQDSFIKAFASLHTLRDPAAFRIWLGSIVVRAIGSQLRRGRLMRALGLGRGIAVDIESIASPRASPVARAELAQLYALLQTLPAAERIAWTLRTVEGHDLHEVAGLCACSLATAKRRIGRAQTFIEEHFVGARPSGDGAAADSIQAEEGAP